nr:immunoglobulin heavy chain junction region [Macaca mulatta]MOY21647.1 immunoglobulin heavy chain junction region [Macaca mulatta]MOY21944.1 immunoglobulin heavy chain junction region [Macaca mulatta]MOY22055.1 immunoglobulin heavy chain junction region [Macaca mulatta]MOY22325.1 immunoglobulin heavy chain junction region [Macaca mulatta]
CARDQHSDYDISFDYW